MRKCAYCGIEFKGTKSSDIEEESYCDTHLALGKDYHKYRGERLCEVCIFEILDGKREPNTREVEHWVNLCLSLSVPCKYFNRLYARPPDGTVDRIMNKEGKAVGYTVKYADKTVTVIDIPKGYFKNLAKDKNLWNKP